MRNSRYIKNTIFILIGLFISPLYVNAVSVSPPTAKSILLYYTLNAGDVNFVTNNVTDRSGHGNIGTLTNGPTATGGKLAQAVSFDGSNDYISVPDSDSWTFSGDFTIALWTNFASIDGAGEWWRTAFVAQDESSGNVNKWIFSYDGNADKLLFHINTTGGGGPTILSSGTWSPSLNRWYHVVISRTGSNYTFYVDGSLNGTATNGTTIPNAASPLTIGWGETLGKTFNGALDEVRVYNRTLSAGELRSLYSAGLPTKTSTSQNTRFTGGLVLNQSFNGPDVSFFSNTAFDRSGQGNNGIFVNMSTSSSRVPAKIGQGLRFDGIDDHIRISQNSSLRPTVSVSVASWVRSTENITNSKIACHDYRGNGTWDAPFISYCLQASASGGDLGKPQLDITTTGSAFSVLTANRVIPLNQWHHIVGTFDSSLSSNQMKIYIDGVLDNQTTKTGIIEYGGTADLAIGADSPHHVDELFRGNLDEVRVYNRALSATEVVTLYKAGGPAQTNVSQNTRFNGGLILNQSFNGPDVGFFSNTAFDRSGQGNNGVLTNMSTSSSPVSGKIGQALRFDGVNDSITLSTATLAPDTGFTVNFWEKYRSSAPQITLRLKGTSKEFIFYQDSLGTPIYAGFRTTGGTNNMVASSPTCTACAPSNNINVWQMYTVTYNGGAKTSASSFGVYRNGVSVGLTSTTAGGDTTNDNVIGVDNNSTSWLNAVLDEVRVYDRVLSATEIQTLFRTGR
jgi:hypothetical protein